MFHIVPSGVRLLDTRIATHQDCFRKCSPDLLLDGLLTVFLAFLYTAFVLDPDDSAGNLRQLGGVIAGIEPGEATAEHIDRVASRITAIGGVYLAAVCLLPDILINALDLPFYFGGPSLLLLVCTMLDLAGELRAYGRAPSRP